MLADLRAVSLLAVKDCAPTFWCVDVTARELWVDNSGGGATVPTDNAINAFARRSGLIGSLSWSGRSLYFDLGTSLRLAVYGGGISFDVLGPNGALGLRSTRAGDPLVRGSHVSITRVNGVATTTGSALGLRQGRLTLRQIVGRTGVAPTIAVPPGVTDLQIFEYSAAAGVANTPWIFEDRLAEPIGQVPLVNGTSSRVMVPGPANAVRLSALPAADTTYTLAFGLEW